MKTYKLPRSLQVGSNENRKRREEKGELIVSFGAGPLVGNTYDPFGLDALWLLVRTVASLGESFTFDLVIGMHSDGFYGGFADGRFCLFDVGGEAVELFTRSSFDLIGSPKVVLEDIGHDLEFWVPVRAFMPFEEMVAVGNGLLLSTSDCVHTIAYQRYDNWDGDGKYCEAPGDSDEQSPGP